MARKSFSKQRRPGLSRMEAAAYLGVSFSTMRRLIEDGTIPFHKVRKSVLIDPDDLDTYWHATERQGVS